LQNALKQNFKNLKCDSVDILMIHEPDRHDDENFMDWWTDKEKYEGLVMDVLKEARDQGKAKFLGLGGTTAYEMPRVMNTGNFDVVLTAFQYNLIWREAEQGVLPTAAAQNMRVVCGSPLYQGTLAAVYENDVIKNPVSWLSPLRQKQFVRLYSLVKDFKMTMPELATRFLLSNPQFYGFRYYLSFKN